MRQSTTLESQNSPQLLDQKINKAKKSLKSNHKKSELSFRKVRNDLANILISFENEINDTAKNVSKNVLKPKKLKQYFKNIKNFEKDLKVITKTLNMPKTSSISKQFLKHDAQIVKHSSFFGVDPLKEIKKEVLKAVEEHKVFTVRGKFFAIQKALFSRGWIEKFHSSFKDTSEDVRKHHYHFSISELLHLVRSKELGDLATKLIKSKLLQSHQPDFYWALNIDVFKENPDKTKLTIINKLKKEIFSFSTKQGLADASNYSYWYQKLNVAKYNHPRSYCLSKKDVFNEFIFDFYNTAAMSLLKWILKVANTKESKLVTPSGKIPLEVFYFAVNECCKLIKIKKHEDIDKEITNASKEEWQQFLEYFYKIVHFSNHFKNDGTETEESLIQKSIYILNHLEPFYPNIHIDGFMNLWILKPASGSQGKGIQICRNLASILNFIHERDDVKYILQKYIERPLLIYSTKFDIRQWFLISSCTPLTIWMYKECYLRFSSQTYNLRKLHESIHLTNNSVQKKYQISTMDAELPSYNMWDSLQFKNYLSNIGFTEKFEEVYLDMKQCITAAILMHQDKIVKRKNCFELYGADFILTEDYQPWLLEINSCPALFASTPITAKMCPRVLEDVIKVVIDYAKNPKASTGAFEILYKETISKQTEEVAIELKGIPLRKSYFYTPEMQEKKDSFYIPNYCSYLDTNRKPQILKTLADEIIK